MKLKNKKNMKTYTLEEVTDKYIGEKGTSKREQFLKQSYDLMPLHTP